MQVVNRNPTASELRTFGRVMLGGFAALGFVLWFTGLEREPWWRPLAGWGWTGAESQAVAVVLWLVGAASAGTCATSPRLGRLLYIAWMTMAMYVGMASSTLLLTILFFVVLPVFALIRLKDPLRLKFKPAGSYWEDHQPHEPTVKRMMRPF